MTLRASLSLLTVATLAACSTTYVASPFNQGALPANLQTPSGHKVVLETVGVGSIAYLCSEKKEAAGQFDWVFVGPDARLMSRDKKQIGRYFGPPATWEANDGSQFTGAQVAIAPNGTGNIPLQLVKANRATGLGLMTDVSYVQRVATMGGTAPAIACNLNNKGERQIVSYQADYIFYKANTAY